MHSTPPLGEGGGSRRNVAMPFGMEKLEWCGYPIVKKFRRYLYSFDMIHERDRHTHRHTHTLRDGIRAYAALMHSIARQKQLKHHLHWGDTYIYMVFKNIILLRLI